LEDVRGERTTLGIEFNFDVPGVRKPLDLFAGIEHNHFGKHSYHH
jgi:hypothetical protein